MGDSNLWAMGMIAELTGSTPVYGETEDGRQTLTIGDVVIVAKHSASGATPLLTSSMMIECRQ